mgnify:CR=1 FL=1
MSGWRLFSRARAETGGGREVGLTAHLPTTQKQDLPPQNVYLPSIPGEFNVSPPQNPDLKPESMWNYEIAFSQRLLGGSLSYGINLFYIDGKNLIMTLPNPSGSGMLNQNSGEIDNAGVEAQVAYRFNKSWSVDANYSYLHMENPVIAAPEHKLYAGANFTQGRWSVSTGIQYIAGLYTSTDPATTEDFVLWNLRGQFRATPWLDIWARGENLLAQRYEINAGYPMPRATVMAGINLNF